MALASIPIKTEKLGAGMRDVDIEFAGLTVSTGEYVYADNNGIIVSNKNLV
jgi:regulator of ribonuclease activity A